MFEKQLEASSRYISKDANKIFLGWKYEPENYTLEIYHKASTMVTMLALHNALRMNKYSFNGYSGVIMELPDISKYSNTFVMEYNIDENKYNSEDYIINLHPTIIREK